MSELCGWCGVAIADGPVLTLEPATIHLGGPAAALTACTDDHLAALRDHYRRRPFVHEELWAGKIARAEANADGVLTSEDLTEATGLDPEQIERCRAWIETQQYRFGGPC